MDAARGVEPLPGEARAEIEALVESCYPNEGCGVVTLNKDGVARVIGGENLGALQATSWRYRLDEALIVAASHRGERLWIIFHSHPDAGAYFSAEDARGALWDWGSGPEPTFPGVDYLVVSVDKGRAGISRRFRFDALSRGFIAVEVSPTPMG